MALAQLKTAVSGESRQEEATEQAAKTDATSSCRYAAAARSSRPSRVICDFFNVR